MNDRYLAEDPCHRSGDAHAGRPHLVRHLPARARTRARGERFPFHLLPLNQAGSLLTLMPSLGSGSNAQPFATVQDYEHWLRRLDGLVVWMDQAIVNMREGMAKGVVQPRPVMEKVLPQLDAMIVAAPAGQPVLRSGEEFPAGFSAADRERLTPRTPRRSRRSAARLPAAARLRARRVPAEDAQHGGVDARCPTAQAWYAFHVQEHTTTDA